MSDLMTPELARKLKGAPLEVRLKAAELLEEGKSKRRN